MSAPETVGPMFVDPFGRLAIRYTPPEDDVDVVLVVHRREPGEPAAALAVGVTQDGVSVEYSVDELVVDRRDGRRFTVLLRWGGEPYWDDAAADDPTAKRIGRRIIAGLAATRGDEADRWRPRIDREVDARIEAGDSTRERDVAGAVGISVPSARQYVGGNWVAYVRGREDKWRWSRPD